MNNQDVQIQVLSYGNGSPSNLVGQKAIELCQKANDQLANYIAQYPNRFVGFATYLSMSLKPQRENSNVASMI